MSDVREATEYERSAVTTLFSEVFAADPFFRWMYPGDDYPELAAAYFGLVCERLWPRARVLVAGAVNGAALWIPPGVPLTVGDDLSALAELLEGQLGERAQHVIAAIGSTEPYIPKERHATCVYVAVRESSRGHGLGGRVMAPALNDYGPTGAGTYLTSTNPRNRSFYERLGFTSLAELSVAANGPVLRPMWRAAEPH